MAGLGIVAAMPSTLAAPQVAASSPVNTLAMGDIVLIASCKASTMFQVTEANPAATGVLTHGLGGPFTPGNATDDLQQRFRSDATVYKMETRHYYVAPSAIRPGTNSLYRLVVPGTAAPVEVASGVDRLLVTYGIDGAADGRASRTSITTSPPTASAPGTRSSRCACRCWSRPPRTASRAARRASISPAARSPSPTVACAAR